MKKTFAFIITICLTLTLFTACGEKTPTGGDTPNTTTPSDNSAAKTTDTPTSSTPDNAPVFTWPDTWPSEVPKLDGEIIVVSDDGIDTDVGITVIVGVAGIDDVKAYAEELVSLGYEKSNENATEGVYLVTLTGETYEVILNYADTEKKCVVGIMK